MVQVATRGEAVYQCSVCNRKTRVPVNKRGMDIINNCIITNGCKGKLNKVTLTKDIVNTPTLTPAVTGLNDWYQRSTLYTHEQTVATEKWEVVHNLNGNPIVHVFLDRLVYDEESNTSISQLVAVPQPKTTLVSSNAITLTFDVAESGLAQFITLSSPNTTNPSSTIITIPTEDNVQVSTDTGLLSIGTLSTLTNVSIEITFIISGQSPVKILYTNIDNTPVSESPWASTDSCFVNGKSYVTRSLDIVSHPAAINKFLTGQIPPQGGSFYVSKVNGVTPATDEVVILGATSPFTAVDRVYDKYVKLTAETSTSGGVLYSFGKIFATSTAIKSVFPFITVV